ncbi:MAG: hypothetical protein ABJZ62_07020, partial [Hyphomicrobiales bacterium]
LKSYLIDVLDPSSNAHLMGSPIGFEAFEMKRFAVNFAQEAKIDVILMVIWPVDGNRLEWVHQIAATDYLTVSVTDFD